PSPPANAFFFQAEDGIRNGHVTGVQTCALPISVRAIGDRLACTDQGLLPLFLFSDVGERDGGTAIADGSHREIARALAAAEPREIGRASCREGGWGCGAAGGG